MIDLETDKILTLADAARSLPPLGGKRPHTSTLWRWAVKGVRGVHLEFGRLGGKVITTPRALNEFIAALAKADVRPSAPVPQRPRPPSGRGRAAAVDGAERRLARAGI